jgi:hypothetical protein
MANGVKLSHWNDNSAAIEEVLLLMPDLLNNRVIVVLGMHRSGTSVLSGLLGLMGASLGPDLMPASPDNEAGYWEHAGVVALHDRLLMALGSSWDDVNPLPDRWYESDAAAPFRKELTELIARDFRGVPLWTIKDPRMCRLAPIWRGILRDLGCETTWVLMTRRPQENVQSLARRDGFSAEKSELLWLRYTLRAELETRGERRVVICYDRLLDDWQGTLARIAGVMGHPWPVPVEQAAAQVARFIDPGKRHHAQADNAGLSWWSRAVMDALALGEAGDDAAMQERMSPIYEGLTAASRLYQPVLRDRARELEQQLAEARANFAHAMDSLADLNSRHAENREKLAESNQELQGKRQLLRQFDKTLGGKINRVLGRFKSKKPAQVDVPDVPACDGRPEVSVLIDLGHDPARTTKCLRALSSQIEGRQVEVFAIGDDASVRPLRNSRSLQIVSTGKARSFARGQNEAAGKARGEYLVFLQDRVAPGDGWLDALLAPLRRDPEIGIVGPEGGTLKRDGTVHLLPGEGAAGPVDFCTAACFAVSKNLFFQAGGFDGYYLPVEEASFGLKVRQTRHKVWREPACHITRHASPPRFDPQRFESHRKRFVQRWEAALAAQP